MGSVQSPVGSAASPLSPTASLQPTWTGYVSDTREALILFEATITSRLHRVVRRPHDRERSALITSGSIFIYEESASGIKRWTDGVPWSPSRILNNFLIYRELEKPFPPGEKKRATKKLKRSTSRPGEPYPRPDGSEDTGSPASPNPGTTPPMKFESNAERDAERSLVGSLTDSYAFKENGLVKKTMSVVVEGVSYHLVSYYNPEDVKQGLLQRPVDSPVLRNITVRSELLHRQNFRAPLDDADDPVQSTYAMPARGVYVQTSPYVQMHGQQDYMQQHSNYGTPQYPMHAQQYQQMYQYDHRGYPPATASHQQQQQSYYSVPPPPMPSQQMLSSQDYGAYSSYSEQRQYSSHDQYHHTPTTNGWSGSSSG